MPTLPGFDDELPGQAARLAPTLKKLAGVGIYLGTSSWKYPGWQDSIYSRDRYLTRGKFSETKFNKTCLEEYARTFPLVGGDFAFYAFRDAEFWKKLFDGIPAALLFGMKVPEAITVAHRTNVARYGEMAGTDNPEFLDTRLFRRRFIEPLEPYADRLATVIFEFGSFNKTTFPKPGDFYARLDPFLGELPEGFRYSIEIRNSEYITPEYFDLLHSHNVAHVFNAWTRAPVLEDQIQLPDAFTADFSVVRALLRKGRGYEQAVKSFEPYERVQDVNEGARAAMADIALGSHKRKKPAFLFINNRLEGNAPSTIEAVIDRLQPHLPGL